RTARPPPSLCSTAGGRSDATPYFRVSKAKKATLLLPPALDFHRTHADPYRSQARSHLRQRFSTPQSASRPLDYAAHRGRLGLSRLERARDSWKGQRPCAAYIARFHRLQMKGWALAVQCPASDGGRRRTIGHFKYAVLLTNRLADEQPLSVLQSSLGRRLPLRYGVLGRLFGADFFVNLFDPIERKDVMAGFRVAFGKDDLVCVFRAVDCADIP